jgi:hypothetical protein
MKDVAAGHLTSDEAKLFMKSDGTIDYAGARLLAAQRAGTAATETAAEKETARLEKVSDRALEHLKQLHTLGVEPKPDTPEHKDWQDKVNFFNQQVSDYIKHVRATSPAAPAATAPTAAQQTFAAQNPIVAGKNVKVGRFAGTVTAKELAGKEAPSVYIDAQGNTLGRVGTGAPPAGAVGIAKQAANPAPSEAVQPANALNQPLTPKPLAGANIGPTGERNKPMMVQQGGRTYLLQPDGSYRQQR